MSTSSAMISRSRSAPTAAAMSVECTTSANSTVTCLYSAVWVAVLRGVPHSLQNFEFGGNSVPQDPQTSPAVVRPPPLPPSGSTPVSCHRWSVVSVKLLGHLRDEELRPSYLFRDGGAGTQAQCVGPLSAGKQASEGPVGQGDRVGLADDVAVQFGIVVEVHMRLLLVSVERDRSAEGIGQGSGAVGLCDDDDGGGGLPCPFVAVAVDADRRP